MKFDFLSQILIFGFFLQTPARAGSIQETASPKCVFELNNSVVQQGGFVRYKLLVLSDRPIKSYTVQGNTTTEIESLTDKLYIFRGSVEALLAGPLKIEGSASDGELEAKCEMTVNVESFNCEPPAETVLEENVFTELVLAIQTVYYTMTKKVCAERTDPQTFPIN